MSESSNKKKSSRAKPESQGIKETLTFAPGGSPAAVLDQVPAQQITGPVSATEIADLVAGIPTNVPIEGNYETYRDFLFAINPINTSVNRAKIQLAWVIGEALNTFLASPRYKRGDYIRLLRAIEMTWTTAHYYRKVAGNFTLENAIKRPSYSDLLREMKDLPDREPRHGNVRGVGDRLLDAVDAPDDDLGGTDDETKGGNGNSKPPRKKEPRGGRPALEVTHENVLLRLEETKAQLIKIKTMNPPNVELAVATPLYDRIRSETVEIIRIARDIHELAEHWVSKNGAYAPPTTKEVE